MLDKVFCDIKKLCWFYLITCNLKGWARGGIGYGILGRFVKFEKVIWVCNVCPHGTTWLPLDRFLWSTMFADFFWKSVRKIQVPLKADNKGYFTWKLVCSCGYIAVCSCGYIAVCICGYIAVCSCGYIAVCSCGYIAVCSCGYIVVCSCGNFEFSVIISSLLNL